MKGHIIFGADRCRSLSNLYFIAPRDAMGVRHFGRKNTFPVPGE